jgi:hypothetical protein
VGGGVDFFVDGRMWIGLKSLWIMSSNSLLEGDGINVQLPLEVLAHLSLHPVDSPATGISLERRETTTCWEYIPL